MPPNDQLECDHRSTLFLVADDRERIRQRVIRINDPNCHAEYPKSRTRRMISNVRIVGVEGDLVTVTANFVCYRFRRYERMREYVGGYRYILQRAGDIVPHQGAPRADRRPRARLARLGEFHFVDNPTAVMPALVAGIDVLLRSTQRKTWMAGTSPAMTNERAAR